MVLKTNAAPRRIEEVFDDRDRSEIHRIISDLRRTYVERHTEALADYHKAERESNRKLHEVDRLERHLKRIEDFCNKNGIPLVNELQVEN